MSVSSSTRVVLMFLLSCFFCFRLAAQSRLPQNADYDSLLSIAKQHNKPMFLAIHQGDEYFDPFDNLSLSQQTSDILHSDFVSGVVRLSQEDMDHALRKQYHVNNPFFIFTDADGYPLLRHDKLITEEKVLLKMIDSVAMIAQGETMGKLLQQYKKGVRSRALLRNLLEKYQSYNLYTDQHVLEDYVSQLTVQELNNFETVVFLLSCGPVHNSQIYRLAYTNHKMVDSLYAELPLPKRTYINGRIIERTFREALDKKDQSLAQQAGYFASSSWGNHYLHSFMASSYHYMQYKRFVRDTIPYVNLARNYYNVSFYRVDIDSLAKLDFAYHRGIDIPWQGNEIKLDSSQNAQFQQWLEKQREHYKATQVQDLNYGANQMLNFGKNNPEATFDAIRWLNKSIELNPNVGRTHHLLAKALYRVGFYAEAETKQRRAVELSKPQKHYHKQMQNILKAIRSRSW